MNPRTASLLPLFTLVGVFAPVVAALAHTPGDMNSTITVVEEKPRTASSSFTVRDRDLRLRPMTRPADVLSVVPGMYVVQHAGGGKANQYFLRGFDIDHGTDVALFVDDIPVNMVSHGHGQGFADLHFLIPELVERVEVYKGPYFARYGDFATAGAVNMVTRDFVEKSYAQFTAGSFDTYRLLAVSGFAAKEWKVFSAAEVYATDGPFESPEGTERFNLFGKATREYDFGTKLSIGYAGYVADWQASGQIPNREVEAGRLDRYGSIDPTEGGSTQRHSVFLHLKTLNDDAQQLEFTAYVNSYRFNLYSNFTFYSADPVNGDMIEQTDERLTYGLRGAYRFHHHLDNIIISSSVGFQGRFDTIENALYTAPFRERNSVISQHQIGQGSLGFYFEQDIAWTPWMRSVWGVRGDSFLFQVEDRNEDQSDFLSRTSGTAHDSLVSPKANLILTPLKGWDIFLNYGRGFHSNDGRGTVYNVDAVTPLAEAVGYEGGFRVRAWNRVDFAASYFVIDLDSELIWVGDAGTTEAGGRTRRQGVEAELRVEILPWLFADVDATISKGKHLDAEAGEDTIALAPELTLGGGVSVQHPSGFFGRLGVFHLGDRAATEDEFLTAEGFTRVDATLGYNYKQRFEVSLAVQNAFDAETREAQFATVSRLRHETDPDAAPRGTRSVVEDGVFLGYEDLHFTPGSPLSIQGTFKFFF